MNQQPSAKREAPAASPPSGARTANGAPSGTLPGRVAARDAHAVDAPARAAAAAPAQGELLAVAERVRTAFPHQMKEAELVLIDVDPRHLYAFWTVPAAHAERVLARIDGAAAPMVLRISPLDTAGDAIAEPFDTEVLGLQGTFYVDVWDTPRRYRATLGYRLADGTLVALAASAVATLPPSAPTEDRTWREIALPAPTEPPPMAPAAGPAPAAPRTAPPRAETRRPEIPRPAPLAAATTGVPGAVPVTAADTGAMKVGARREGIAAPMASAPEAGTAATATAPGTAAVAGEGRVGAQAPLPVPADTRRDMPAVTAATVPSPPRLVGTAGGDATPPATSPTGDHGTAAAPAPVPAPTVAPRRWSEPPGAGGERAATSVAPPLASQPADAADPLPPFAHADHRPRSEAGPKVAERPFWEMAEPPVAAAVSGFDRSFLELPAAGPGPSESHEAVGATGWAGGDTPGTDGAPAAEAPAHAPPHAPADAADHPSEGPPALPLPPENVIALSSFLLSGDTVELEVNAELHVFGRVKPGSRLLLFGRPVSVRPDGTFSVHRPLGSGAAIMPVLLTDAEQAKATAGDPVQDSEKDEPPNDRHADALPGEIE